MRVGYFTRVLLAGVLAAPARGGQWDATDVAPAGSSGGVSSAGPAPDEPKDVSRTGACKHEIADLCASQMTKKASESLFAKCLRGKQMTAVFRGKPVVSKTCMEEVVRGLKRGSGPFLAAARKARRRARAPVFPPLHSSTLVAAR